MSSSSHPIHLASPVVVVRFPKSFAMEPLTTTEADLHRDVERYLQRRVPRPLTVTTHEDDQRGTVRHGNRLVTTFVFGPLGATNFGFSSAVAA